MRFEWGATGGGVVASGADVVVVVDVLGFCGSVSGRLESGVDVVPVPPHDATLAAVSGAATTVVAAGLRNAPAVADWLAREHDADRAVLAVVAAGSRWPDGSLRPAVEDLWGAGAVLAALEDHDWPGLSPEAAQAADAYRLVSGREAAHLAACAGGRELAAEGQAVSLEEASLVGADRVVPLLGDRGFVAAP